MSLLRASGCLHPLGIISSLPGFDQISMTDRLCPVCAYAPDRALTENNITSHAAAEGSIQPTITWSQHLPSVSNGIEGAMAALDIDHGETNDNIGAMYQAQACTKTVENPCKFDSLETELMARMTNLGFDNSSIAQVLETSSIGAPTNNNHDVSNTEKHSHVYDIKTTWLSARVSLFTSARTGETLRTLAQDIQDLDST